MRLRILTSFSKVLNCYLKRPQLEKYLSTKVIGPKAVAVEIPEVTSAASLSLTKQDSILKKMSEFVYPNNTPVVLLDCTKAFSSLTDKEKLYSHHISKASQYGGLIVLVQTSLESPLIYILLHKVFRAQPISELRNLALSDCDFSEDDFKAFLIYASAVFSNMGNYKGMGDVKFIPNLCKEKFVKLVQSSKAASLQPEKIQSLIDRCADKVYSLTEGEKQLGFHDVGLTTYFSKNFTKEDSDVVKSFFKKKNFSAYNSRVFKTVDETGNSTFEIRLASVAKTEDSDECDLVGSHTANGHKFVVTRGDYRELLEIVNKNLLQAKEYAANANQLKMLEYYIQSFQTGSIDAHKEGSRHWIRDIGPVVETYIGFIETYRDPAGMRGEFEGFVAMVNKPMSKKFGQLVSEAENFLPLLPWPKSYEKDKFLQPDFTSLDVLTFSGSGVPAGINIPNYDEIKQSEGFKNVSLGNVIPAAYKAVVPNYLNKSDQDLLDKYKIGAFEVQVGLHELLGHGSGKQFCRDKDGKFNFDTETVRDLETNKKITSWYEEGETYDSIFTSLGSPFEECRAECVGLYLSTIPAILKIFGYEGAEADDVMYANWLSEAHNGLESLQMYEPKTKMWLQAHSQARYAILQVLLEAGEDFVTVKKVKGEDGNPDLLFTMDRTKILSVGAPAIGKFLQKIQLYRSTADVKRAKAMFDKYSAVTSEDMYPFLNYREIVIARKKPRKLLVQANTFIENDKVTLKNYNSSPEGMIESWLERYENNEELDCILEELWRRDQPYFS